MTSSPASITRSPGSACGRAPFGPEATIGAKETVSAPSSRIRVSIQTATSRSLRPISPRPSSSSSTASVSAAEAAIAAISAASLERRSGSTTASASTSSAPSPSASSIRRSSRTLVVRGSKPIRPVRCSESASISCRFACSSSKPSGSSLRTRSA